MSRLAKVIIKNLVENEDEASAARRRRAIAAFAPAEVADLPIREQLEWILRNVKPDELRSLLR